MKFLVILSFITFSKFSFSTEKLKLIGDFNIATSEKFKDTEIGGLSGLTYDAKTKRLLVISDDKSVINPARFYEFDLTLDEKSFSIKPADVITLKDENGKNFEKHTVDFEGISLNADKIYISSEGALNRDKEVMPGVYEFSRDGKLTKKLEIPEKFLHNPDLDKKNGPRDNLVFEALSTTPDGKNMFVGMEEALLQDDNVSTPFYSSKTRIIKYADLKPTKEYLYQLDKVPSIAVAGLTIGETGLVDMTAIDENNAYTLERSHLPLAHKFHIRIFKITNLEKATDISKMETVKNVKNIVEVDKELLLNLDDIIPSLNEKFKTLDNLEGMCFGPILANGHQTLLLVSDNNFNKNQRTQFLAFEIIPDATKK